MWNRWQGRESPSAQTMLNTLSGIMRMSESAGVLRYSWAQGLQQHRPTSNLDPNPLARFLGPGRQQLRACLFSSRPLLTTTTLGFYSSVQHNCSGTTQVSDLRGPEEPTTLTRVTGVVTGYPLPGPAHYPSRLGIIPSLGRAEQSCLIVIKQSEMGLSCE